MIWVSDSDSMGVSPFSELFSGDAPMSAKQLQKMVSKERKASLSGKHGLLGMSKPQLI